MVAASTSDPQNLNDLLTGSLQKEFSNPELDWRGDGKLDLLLSTPQKRSKVEMFRIWCALVTINCTGIVCCERKLSFLQHQSP